MRLKTSVVLLIITIPLFLSFGSSVLAQASIIWSPRQRVPGYENDTLPPILIADRNRTVHAISSQWLTKNDGTIVRGIMYSQWSLNRGWTRPINILLSPIKNDARVIDAKLDPYGRIDVVFWGGDNTGANIYYSSALIDNAESSKAWSAPILVAKNAQDPDSGVLYFDDQNNFVILFAGISEGNGLYSTNSSDRGIIWSKPILVFNTQDSNYLMSDLQIFKSDSGWIHAIWNKVNAGGQGRGIYYSKKKIGELTWSEPEILAGSDTGYGTNTPAIVEYHDIVFTFYNLGGFIMQRSNDGVSGWTSPKKLFSRQVGVNGTLSLVVDGSDVLHIFFGQRIPGSPDIHGMWHSIWMEGYWSQPEAITSGPRVMSGDNSFDPFNARAVVCQGNVILVTWQTDPGNGVDNENGVWYSYTQLNNPESPLENIQPTLITPTSVSNLVNGSPDSTPTADTGIIPEAQTINNSSGVSLSSNNPVNSILTSILPVFLALIILIFGIYFIKRQNR